MSLPDLPTVKKKREADCTPAILSWFRANASKIGSCLIEIKATTSNSIPASAVATHQLAALRQASGEGLCYKIPDFGYTKKPADAFLLAGSRAFVVCAFLKHRVVLVIEADKWHGCRFSSSDYYATFPL